MVNIMFNQEKFLLIT